MKSMDDSNIANIDPGEARKLVSGKLAQLETHWRQLIYGTWNPQMLSLVAGLADEVTETCKKCGFAEFSANTAELAKKVRDCSGGNQQAGEGTRQGITALLTRLRSDLPSARQDAGRASQEPKRKIVPEIWLLDSAPSGDLMTQVQSVGLPTRRLKYLSEVIPELASTHPSALLVDIDSVRKDKQTAEECLSELGNALDEQDELYVFSSSGELNVRLAAAKAGCHGFFTKPVNRQSLVTTLKSRILRKSLDGRRVLVVNDNPVAASKVVDYLEPLQVLCKVECDCAAVPATIEQFHPNLILLDLDLNSMDGRELARALQQDSQFGKLPMIFLADDVRLVRNRVILSDHFRPILSKPISAADLMHVVSSQLRDDKEMRDTMQSLSNRDPISGLFNRGYFVDELERVFGKRASSAGNVGIMLIVLDNLRAVRDATDVTIADAVIGMVAQRLREVVGKSLSARFGEAMFAVLVTEAEAATITAMAKRLSTAISDRPYTSHGHSLRIRTSIGISLSSPEQEDYLSLIRNADRACNLARENANDHVHLDDQSVDRDEHEALRREQVEEIREAVDSQRFGLVFQPIPSLRGDVEARYEVLLRMNNKDGRELLPEVVFGYAEERKLGSALDRWAIGRCLSILQQRDAAGQDTHLFVNLSTASLLDSEFDGWLKPRLEKAGINPSRLILEVNEKVAEHNKLAYEGFMRRCRKLGVSLSLDRFGRGANSMGMLDILDVQYVKLDSSFTSQLTADVDKQQNLKNTMIKLDSRNVLGVVGAVEDLNALPTLWACNANLVQGFFLQRPHKDMNYDFSSGIG